MKTRFVQSLLVVPKAAWRGTKAAGAKFGKAIDKFEPTARRISVVTSLFGGAYFVRGLFWGNKN
jgi:hypothetical protein